MIRETGQVLPIVIIASSIILVTVLLLTAGARLYFTNSVRSIEVEQTMAIVEGGIDKAVVSINKIGASYTGETGTKLGNGLFDVSVTDKDQNTKIIESIGYIPNKLRPKVKRTVRVEAAYGIGENFSYGIHAGSGGVNFSDNNDSFGPIFSNGSILLGGNNTLTGEIWVAGNSTIVSDQQTTSCITCLDYLFGKTVNGERRFDLAQSFKPSVDGYLTKVSLNIYKVGLPSDLTVRIVKDSSGKPDKNNVLATENLSSSLINGIYSWVDITLTTPPNLVKDTDYWIVVDSTEDLLNYWSWQTDFVDSYSRGSALYSEDWVLGSLSWITLSSDLSFKVYIGNNSSSIKALGLNNKVAKYTSGPLLGQGGNVYADNIDNLFIEGNVFYQTISNSTVLGQSTPGATTPLIKNLPISARDLSKWKQLAGRNILNFGSCTSGTIGPGKINGNMLLGGSCSLTVKSPLWITGDLTGLDNNTLTLSGEHGSGSGVIVVDGKVDLGSNNHFIGTQGNSILMVLSTYDSKINGLPAIKLGTNGTTGVFYASDGILDAGSNNEFKQLTGWGINLGQGSKVVYDQSLSNTLFTSGSLGSFTIVPGTYQVK